ncbi:MAG: FtsQ-type POTRA domain-containing protein [Bdellovibrionales bacterium]|nr:FtsQ-type POTRA domain-containing protein [Bdellovibrionales bacterium]NQZ18341.1 FtsQ-type POTRA domain-containing protein [Bdellovibrionales bacterium]
MLFKKIRKVFFIVIPVVAIGLLGWSLRFETEFFLVQKVPVDIQYKSNVEGSLKLLKSTIEAETKALKGINIWKSDINGLREKLITNDWIKNVEIQRELPQKVYVKVDLEDIVFLYVDSQNRLRPFTQTGKVLKRVPKTSAPLAPLVRNKKILKDKGYRKQIIELFSEVPNIQSLNRNNIAEVDLGNVTGLSVKLINEEAVVYLGTKNISTKGLRVLRVTDYLKSQKQKARVIDASFSKKVLVRPRKRS